MAKKKMAVQTVKVVNKPVVVDHKTLKYSGGLKERIHEFVAVKKQAIQARRGSYRAAMNPRSRNLTPYGGSGDTQVDIWSRRYLRELSRDMDRNADTFRILADAFTAAVVGEGVKYRPTTEDPEWNKEAARVIDEYMKKDRDGVDVRGMRSGYKIFYDMVRAFVVDGETGTIKLSNGKLQCFETEQLTNGGKLIGLSQDGVEMDKAGKPTAYHIVPYGLRGQIELSEGHDFPVEDVEWLANRSRFSQTRGVPMLVASLDDWERLDSYRESEIIAAEQGSQIYGVIEHPESDLGTASPFSSNNATINPSSIVNGGVNQTNSDADWQPTVAGALMDLPRGLKYVPVEPGRPNPDAVDFMLELIRQFCANTGLPYEYIYNDVRGLSWSVNRALVQMARDRISIWQTQFFGPIFSNIYKWLIPHLVESGELTANEEWEKHELSWPKISWPDEGAEYEAQANGLQKALTTRHRIHGPHWRDILDERAEELDYAAALAEKHNAAHEDFPVTPMFFLGFEEAGNSSGDVHNQPDQNDGASGKRSPKGEGPQRKERKGDAP